MVFTCVTLRALLVGVLALAAIGKLRSRDRLRAFAASVAALGRIPPGAAGVLSPLVPCAELATAGLIAWPPTARLGCAAALAMLAGFTVVLAGTLARGSPAPCNCFGGSAEPVRAGHLARNGLLLLAAGSGLLLSDAAPVPAVAGVLVLGLALGTGAAFLVSRWDDLHRLLTTH
ncbi:hypothetical protein Lfu02_79510 [Longispora fulva]|uniref:Methylamine utilisation protein MauE domain-containing protein n=1 Tax=Longispora fulva TaxID=619741 RepID=A0A8J7GGK2_9ACTN|nr:MauE/DoxX family redox-associated membrane protein [Longispora fulva]MBG6133994.1 hypothetical protein [Longispora fulva]GIG63579.1 hypothetical protein Lfu02_79510 [Longispora fulva]